MSYPTPDEDDNNSLYCDSPLPAPDTRHITHQILDPNDLCVIQLDRYLDDEDERYALEHPSEDVEPCDEEEDYSTTGEDDDTELGEGDDDDERGEEEIELSRANVGVSADYMAQKAENGNAWAAGKPHEDEESVKIVDMDENDYWFDSDENKVDVESLHSTSSEGEGKGANGSARLRREEGIVSVGAQRRIEGSKSDKQTATSAGGGGSKSLFIRASQTFYKAWRKGGGKKIGVIGEKGMGVGNVVEGEEEEAILDVRYARLEEVLEAQIATLNGARSGFVDLTLLRPMTERTVEVIVKDGKELLKDFGRLERRAREMDRGGEGEEGEEEIELRLKEGMLIEAKVRLAEAAAEVEGLRHELRMLQRQIDGKERMEVRAWQMGKVKREQAGREVEVASEARRAAEVKLKKEWEELERERNVLQRVEKGFRDIQGDWA